MDNARALVIVGELAQFNDVYKVALPSFNKEVHRDADVIEGEEVMTLRTDVQGMPTLFRGYV